MHERDPSMTRAEAYAHTAARFRLLRTCPGRLLPVTGHGLGRSDRRPPRRSVVAGGELANADGRIHKKRQSSAACLAARALDGGRDVTERVATAADAREAALAMVREAALVGSRVADGYAARLPIDT